MDPTSRRHHGPVVFEGEPAVDAVLKQAWYAENVDSVPDDARNLLEEYSGLKPEEVVPHVLALVTQPPHHTSTTICCISNLADTIFAEGSSLQDLVLRVHRSNALPNLQPCSTPVLQAAS